MSEALKKADSHMSEARDIAGSVRHPADLVRVWRFRAVELADYAPEVAKVFDRTASELEGVLGPRPMDDAAPSVVVHQSWRERLWVADPNTRIGRDELLQALGRSKAWLYERTSEKAPRAKRIPHRKDTITGELVFVVGEVRDWLRAHEVVIIPGTLAKSEAA